MVKDGLLSSISLLTGHILQNRLLQGHLFNVEPLMSKAMELPKRREMTAGEAPLGSECKHCRPLNSLKSDAVKKSRDTPSYGTHSPCVCLFKLRHGSGRAASAPALRQWWAPPLKLTSAPRASRHDDGARGKSHASDSKKMQTAVQTSRRGWLKGAEQFGGEIVPTFSGGGTPVVGGFGCLNALMCGW